MLHAMLLMLQLYIGMALGIQADNDFTGTSGMLAPGTRVFLTCFISLAHMLGLYGRLYRHKQDACAWYLSIFNMHYIISSYACAIWGISS